MAALAESSDWGGVDPICALRESAVGASQSFRESLALGAIELAQLAPTDGLRKRHLLFAARLAESLTWRSSTPGEAETTGSAATKGSPADWAGVIARIYDQITASHGDEPIPVRRGKDRLDALAPGRRAPRFVARDTAGNEVRSSDFEGKIVLYRFWSDRSAASIAAHEEDLALLRLFWDTPFELVGISSDLDRKKHLDVLAESRVGGTQIYDGPIGTELVDALARAGNNSRTTPTSSTASWNFPTVGSSILVDSAGVIRAHNLHGAALEQAIQGLVAEHRIRLREQRLTGQSGD